MQPRTKALRADASLEDSKDETSQMSRLEARIPTSVKREIERAAALEGRSVTSYIVEHLGAAARETIDQREVIRLSPLDTEYFVRTLLNPPVPSENLRKAWAQYRDMFGE